MAVNINDVFAEILKDATDQRVEQFQIGAEKPDADMLRGTLIFEGTNLWRIRDLDSDTEIEATRFVRPVSSSQELGRNNIPLGSTVFAIKRGGQWILVGNPELYS